MLSTETTNNVFASRTHHRFVSENHTFSSPPWRKFEANAGPQYGCFREMILSISFILMIVSVCIHTAKAFPFKLPRTILFCRKRLASSSSSSAMSLSAALLEVEEKFNLMDRNLNELKLQLTKLGFVEKRSIEMEDWYFDDSNYSLTRQDCWLRFRKIGDDKKDGQWELKRGRQRHNQSTVYEEIEGLQGFDTAFSLLLPSQSASAAEAIIMFDECSEPSSVPTLPRNDSNLRPFARIWTQRSSWKSLLGRFSTLSIDLDATDYGHAVGEVEALVSNEQQVPKAQALIRELLSELLPHDYGETLPIAPKKCIKGKLEAYIELNRPKMYEILVDAGILVV